MPPDSVDPGALEPDPHRRVPQMEDAAEAMGNAVGRQQRHVLIPSELVSVELSLADGTRQTLQADLINVSSGGCCLVLPRRLPLESGAEGVMRRPGEVPGSQESRVFVVRWLLELGEMMEIGAQYIEA